MFKCVLNKHLNTFGLLQSEPQASTKALCAVDGQPAIVPVVVHPANALALVRLCGTGTDKKLGYLPVVWVTLLVWAQMCSNVFKCVQMCFSTLPHLDTFEKCGLLQMCLVVPAHRNVFKCWPEIIRNVQQNTFELNVPQMCFTCVSNVLKCVCCCCCDK